MNSEEEVRRLSRRGFVKGSALGALALAAGSGAFATLYGCANKNEPDSGQSGQEPDTEQPGPGEQIVWSHCNVNCGGRCALQFHVVDGELAYLESDNTASSSFDGLQSRACLRGRSIRRWINSPDRLQYPMKRVGKRGLGEFERITWDEAISTIYEHLKNTIDTYGNEAVYVNYATGVYAVTGSSLGASWFERMMNLVGGYLTMYGDYSTAQITTAMPYTYGNDSYTASPMIEAMNSDLVILFGNSPADTRMGGANTVHDLARVRESGARIINVDYRLNESSSAHPDEWLPIRPGTDAALCGAIAHVWITENLVDEEFVHSHCVGYDAETMPEGAPANASYKDYILGSGEDGIAKTPEWASAITQIPAEKIIELAHDIANAQACYICQGWGPQRHSNGEFASRAIVMLPILSGHIGKPGTSTGVREAMPGAPVASLPIGENPVETSISCFSWTDAIDHGEQMTATHDGIRGADALSCGIKFLWNYGGNCITNQHGQINRTFEILQDESKCEFIVVCDTVMTDSAKYADILLPDAMRTEQVSMSTNGYSEYFSGVIFGQKVVDPKFECRTSYDMICDLADKFGVKEALTEGRTEEEWIKFLYEEARGADSSLPSYEDGLAMGIYKTELPSYVGLEAFCADPEQNPLSTPSGKIEIYSSELAEMAQTWTFDDPRDFLHPLPIYAPGYESHEDTSEEYPLVLAGFHYKSRTHSSFGFIDLLKQACRQQVWINPVDAEPRGISTGDKCRVNNERGTLEIEAKVTPRIIPGTIAIPQGSWHDADMNGDKVDKGGCINTLTTLHPSPLAKGNSHHTNIAQLAKI
ncbi:MAG: molybdopterin-dependent oxidoreductase [Coriobacteriales bacterium]|jgi:DmsA/YnfE family anaerobic dimethyl sulfoxide reductase A subunit|nr:molybdopterin-dependent oxidoreductase [Coriobacteriales bacterium]